MTTIGGYHIADVAHIGDVAILYAVEGDPSALFKVAREPVANELIEREARALQILDDQGDPQYLPYVPRLVDAVRLRDPGTGVERAANVLGTVAGLHSLTEVLQIYPEGLDPRDVAWMWRRLLVALGFVHRCGIVHGAVFPEHVLIEPDQHGVVLVDWCYAAIGDGGRLAATLDRYARWYPQEVIQREAVGPGTDIALATRCMRALMGRNAPPALDAFARGCLLAPLSRRPDDAWRLLDELDETLERCFGPRRFRPFTLSR